MSDVVRKGKHALPFPTSYRTAVTNVAERAKYVCLRRAQLQVNWLVEQAARIHQLCWQVLAPRAGLAAQ